METLEQRAPSVPHSVQQLSTDGTSNQFTKVVFFFTQNQFAE